MRARMLMLAAGLSPMVLLVAACGGGGGGGGQTSVPQPAGMEGMTIGITLESAAFSPSGAIPQRFTCDGAGVSPALQWGAVPAVTESLTLIVDDPDVPGGPFTHWVLVNLPASTRELPEGVQDSERLGSGALQGTSGFSKMGYAGPCPPPGAPHHYRFALYALDTTLTLGPGPTERQALDALRGHVLAGGWIVGTYQRQS